MFSLLHKELRLAAIESFIFTLLGVVIVPAYPYGMVFLFAASRLSRLPTAGNQRPLLHCSAR